MLSAAAGAARVSVRAKTASARRLMAVMCHITQKRHPFLRRNALLGGMRRTLLAIAAAACLAAPAATAAPAAPPLGAQTYAGLGTWIDVFDGPAWSNPEAAVRTARRNGATI